MNKKIFIKNKVSIKNKVFTKNGLLFFCLLFLLSVFLPATCRAMPPGALVYRTSSDGKMYGYSGDPLIYSSKGIMKNIYSGHVGIYIGKENGVDYVVEALAGGVVMTPAEKFVNLAEGEKYLGAKIPKDLTAVQQAKVVQIARSLVGMDLAYDTDFKVQKGPNSGEWTCVGLTEKLYESANISNPNNLDSLEYDYGYYAVDITTDGFDNYSVVNSKGDCFSKDYEFSKIARRTDLLLPAPEFFGYDVGLEIEGERFIFLPYTQFLQPTLTDVSTDIKIASSFSGAEVRGSFSAAELVLRWSLINNPVSSIKTIAQKAGNLILSLKDKIFGTSSDVASGIVLNDVVREVSPELALAVKARAIVNKATKSTTTGAAKEKTPTLEKLTAQASGDKSKKLTAKVVKNSELIAKSAAARAEEKISSTKATSSPIVSKVSDAPKTTAKASSTVVMATYYNPVSAPVSTVSSTGSGSSSSGGGSSGGGGNSSASSQTVDNYPKIASINKIYATGDNDWIELYNSTDRDFDLAAAGYRIERARTSDDSDLAMRIGDVKDGSYPGGTIIKAHDYYLIVKSTASSYYLSKADAVATREEFSWPSSGYTLYLGTDAITASNDPDIVEAIGFGPDATYFQGSGPAQEIKDYYVLSRVKSGSNNNSDFNLIKSDDPSIDWLAMENKNASSTEEVATSTDNVATSSDEIAESPEETATSSENISTSSEEIIADIPVVINKIYATGENDWIELYNPTDSDFDLATAGYRLEKAETSEDPDILMRVGNPVDGSYPKGTIVKANSTYLIVRDEANDFYKSKANAIATRTDFVWDNSGHTIYSGKDAISSSTDSDIIEAVGFGVDATYFQGSGPANAITDNYILNRVASNGNNNSDFNLIKSDDPNINWLGGSTGGETSNGIYNFSASAYNLFSPAEPIASAGLKYLWHFDECSGTNLKSAIGSSTLISSGVWIAGKFGCAQEAGVGVKKIQTTFSEPMEINNSSFSFWFKATQDYPRLSLTLSNDQEYSINVTLENGLMQFSGLPNPDWRYYTEFPFDSIWRQATLVINRDEGYWALYIDGVEKFHINSYQIFSPMDKLEIFGNNGPYAIDEVAVWDRALSPEEIISIRSGEGPFMPFVSREPQEIAVLKHFWNFNEGIGTSTADLIGNVDLTVNKNSWKSLNLTNSVFVNRWGQDVNANIPVLESPDLSLTFKWRSADTTIGNRARIALRNEANSGIFSTVTGQFNSGYKFAGTDSYFSYGGGLGMPLDTNWHNVAMVYDSYRYLLRFYIDGVEKGGTSLLWLPNRPLADALEIVAENGSVEIDDLGIWEGSLSPKQIQEIFANN